MITTYDHLPQKHLDVFTFEVKPSDQLNILGVYEALAHSRRSNFAYVLYQVVGESPELEEIKREAIRLRVGVLTFEDPEDFDTWSPHCFPQRHETEPRFLDEFIANLPLEKSKAIKQRIR